jgi:outer membrane protein assembly factor BamB
MSPGVMSDDIQTHIRLSGPKGKQAGSTGPLETLTLFAMGFNGSVRRVSRGSFPGFSWWSWCAFFWLTGCLWGADQPQWGEAWTRNLVSAETNLPVDFDPVSGRNLRWKVELGTDSYATPITAGGRVYIGTNNERPRDARRREDAGVLLCFDEATGQCLWQLVTPKLEGDPYYDWPKTGMSSPVTVEDGKVYFVNNRAEVMCLDARGSAPEAGGAHGSDTVPTARVIWKLDLVGAAGIWPHDGAHTSILIDGPYLYLNTGTGVDNTHKKIRTPNAPSLVVIEKATGRLVARDEEKIAPWIFHATWSSPSMATVGGRRVVLMAGGDGIVYGFEPLSGAIPPTGVRRLRKVWHFDFDPSGPKSEVHRFNGNRQEGPSTIYGMPVVVGDRLFVAGGGDLWWGKNESWLKCVDLRGLAEPGSGAVLGREIWAHPLGRHTMSTPSVTRGLVFVTDTGRQLHCLDAATGDVVWTHEFASELWASPLIADGKVYLGSRRGDFCVFAAERMKRLLGSTDIHQAISGTATAANGTIYIATATDLYAVGFPRPLR